MVDDLRPALGCYGDQAARTPHMDSLARQGTLFTGAYASVATCSPSRTSILTGLRPDTHGVYDLVTHFRETVPSATTLPQLLRRKGYTTVSYGKIFHEGLDDAQSWTPQSEFDDGQPSRGTNRTYGDNWWYMDYDDRETQRAWKGHKFGRVTEQSERPASQHMDHAIATRAVDALARLGGADAKKPFFIAVGFVRPHLPWTAPAAAWQRIPKKELDEMRDGQRVYNRGVRPANVSEMSRRALAKWGELRAYSGVHPVAKELEREKALRLAHGYYASVSWADEQVGRVLSALVASPAAPTTVTVLLSDHGWKIGDWGAWSKHTTFEADVRVPLIVRAPPAAGLPASAPPALRRAAAAPRGVSSRALVELIDVLPTIAELAGVSVDGEIDGRTFSKLLANASADHRKYALSQWLMRTHNGEHAHNCWWVRTNLTSRRECGGPTGFKDIHPCMAYRMRTQRLALTQWVAANASVDAATNCSQSVEVYLMGGTVPHEQANLAHTARGDTLLAAFGDEMRRHIDRWRPEPEEYEAEAPPVIHFASYADTLEATSATPTNPTPAKKYTGRQTRIKIVVTKKGSIEDESIEGDWLGANSARAKPNAWGFQTNAWGFRRATTPPAQPVGQNSSAAAASLQQTAPRSFVVATI